MKKYLCLLLLFSVSNAVLADNLDVKVEPTLPNSKPTRSVIIKPKVQIDNQSFVLSVMMNMPNESFTVYVYDERGAVVYQDIVIADGYNYQYMLPNLDFGNYSITIENGNLGFSGDFDI